MVQQLCVQRLLRVQSRRRNLPALVITIELKPVHTVAEKCDSRRISPLCRRFRDSRTFLRQCGQGFRFDTIGDVAEGITAHRKFSSVGKFS